MHCKIAQLSGGERSRLLLAKLFLKPSNVLVLDEPTNDLDIETLELLESLLVNYNGTVLLVSHDRSFLENVVTSTLVFGADAQLTEYIGYDQALTQAVTVSEEKPVKPNTVKVRPKRPRTQGLNYNEQHRLKQLPQLIEALEADVEAQQTQMLAADFYQQPAEQVKACQQALAKAEAELADLYAEWEALDAKQA